MECSVCGIYFEQPSGVNANLCGYCETPYVHGLNTIGRDFTTLE